MSMRRLFKLDADKDTETPSVCELSPSMNPNRRLSQLSTIAKSAMTLNEIYRVEISSTYDTERATIYVVSVFLRTTQKGLPTMETLDERRRRLRIANKGQTPDYQVEHRYSEFRAMSKSISDVVNDHDHFRFCAYCSRLGTIESASGFPPRVPNPLATGWRHLLTRIRKHRLERFMNEMLKASKDMSYRSGSSKCVKFLLISKIMHDFLSQCEESEAYMNLVSEPRELSTVLS